MSNFKEIDLPIQVTSLFSTYSGKWFIPTAKSYDANGEEIDTKGVNNLAWYLLKDNTLHHSAVKYDTDGNEIANGYWDTRDEALQAGMKFIWDSLWADGEPINAVHKEEPSITSRPLFED